METKSHLVVSAALGVAIAAWIGAAPPRAAFVVGYAAFVGTAIDLDHFLIARLRVGDWHNLRFAIGHPRAAVLEQDRLFEEGAVGTLTRLLSHVLLAGLAIAGLAVVDGFLALLTAAVLYVHLLCDLIAGVRKYELPLRHGRAGRP